MFAPDLAWYIKGARDHKWPLRPLRDGMKGNGLITCWPPNCTYVGEVMDLLMAGQRFGATLSRERTEGKWQEHSAAEGLDYEDRKALSRLNGEGVGFYDGIDEMDWPSR